MNERFEVRDYREPGWFFIDNCLLDEYGHDLGVHAIAVYAALCRHANLYSQKAWPSIRRICKLLGAGHSQVSAAIQRLENAGLIAVERREGRSNLYKLLKINRSHCGNGSGKSVPTVGTHRSHCRNGTRLKNKNEEQDSWGKPKKDEWLERLGKDFT